MNKKEFIVGVIIGVIFIALIEAAKSAHYSNCVHTMIGDQPIVVCQ